MLFAKFLAFLLVISEIVCIFAPQFCDKQNAQMAESVDALVSNTSGATHPGSTPGLGTPEKEIPCELKFARDLSFCLFGRI